jgi:serine/threonine protein kinase
MNASTPKVETILAQAVEITAAEERHAFVEQACAGNAELKRRVERLVANHFRAGRFLEQPAFAVDLDATAGWEADGAAECPGSMIGPYKLLEQIGEGGIGVVYVAEQSKPVRRKVALKIIKPGMDTKQVIARFEAERQALAMMDHPNVARVIDAGATEGGRPYFVMELVRGIPVTEYATASDSRSPSDWNSSSSCAGPCNTRTRRGSSTET